MTSPEQAGANSANAAKSTRPRTERVKAISSRNELKHGLTSPPTWDNVTKYYRLITREPSASRIPNLAQDRSRNEKSRSVRVYVIIRDGTANKNSQQKDIELAQRIWKELGNAT